ncbi:unnamed protein product [Linum tenue]|uniref:Cytochrome P450 n=1 Tax=Linum tenue TaxID=586396 RepID=A0AAV0H3P4_9ROSI|nr:unnamed protein product [Linum tenue]
MRSNTGEKWLEQRIRKYGPVSKLSLFGNPSVFIHGQAANKLVFSGDGSALASSQTKSVRMVLGAQNLLELRGDDHKRVRGAMVSFLKAESLKQYVGKMDQEVRLHIQTHWKGKHEEKRAQLQHGAGGPRDLITSLVDMNNSQAISDGEIIDNIKLVMTAGHDTSSVVITLVMRLLSNQPSVCAAVLKDIEFEGYLIPKGWQTHMDQTIFPEPERFDPTRFENTTSVPPYCYIPFGGGARICPGYEFAKVEILVAIHYIVTQFTWKMCADNRFSRDPMPVPTKGLPIKIEPRNRNIGL